MSFRDPHTRRTLVFCLATIALLGILLLIPFATSPRSVGAREAFALLQSDAAVVVLDVRTTEEFSSSTGRIEGAILIPLDSLGTRMDELSRYKGRTMLVYCRSGLRSRNAVALLEKHGHTAINLVGGILEWNSLGLPVTGKKER